MATFSAKVFKHHKKADGTYNVKICISHNRDRRYVDTVHYVSDKKLNKDLSIKDTFLNSLINACCPHFNQVNLRHTVYYAVTPDSMKFLLKDLFAVNTYWDLKTTGAAYKPFGKDKWFVSVDVEARKVTVDNAGKETEIAMNDPIEIGIFAKDSKGAKRPLYLQMRRVRSGINHFAVVVSGKPAEAGIDPRNLLIDTDSDDNIKGF